ncbi:MAG: DNA-directed RNA polymerase subunit beta [Endomicrobium sp.]|jgi:DNA-directed RNA polymerase subunit beta|nr:DNA-directed RNA polymerase subunit beta [Endomicrobium sp.]
MNNNKVNFGKIKILIDPPFLLKMQKDSFDRFLQQDTLYNKRKLEGLEEVLQDIFPLKSSDGTLVLEYISYSLGPPRYSVEESIIRNLTYAKPLKVRLKLINNEQATQVEQEVYFGDLPIMTDTATFVINGAERVVVSQIHRSPGIIFEDDDEKRTSFIGKPLYSAKIIPYRGAWLEFEFDQNEILNVRIDRKKKILVSTFLRAIGFETDNDILNLFSESHIIKLKDNINEILSPNIISENIFDTNGTKLVSNGQELTNEIIAKLKGKNITEVAVFKDISILLTIKKDHIKTKKDALNYIYKIFKTQDFIIQSKVDNFLEALFFQSTKKYDLTAVGRYKLIRKLNPILNYYSKKLNLSLPTKSKRTLDKLDIVATIKYLLKLHNGDTDFVTIENNNTYDEQKKSNIFKLSLDDIDHLGNRRIRAVGELLENQIRIGLIQMTRFIRDRMNNSQDKINLTPKSLVNVTQFTIQIKKFFGTSRLSQFMDQINPLAELTHKRRLSALGPGGLNRKRAGFEVRDVHHTHYGRICPIETPEGPNIGLITSLSTFARINIYGLIETPYKKVQNGVATNQIEYLTADEEDEFFVAQANTQLDQNGKIVSDLVQGRKWDDFLFRPPSEVDYMDISPMQVISISAALIPFLEHDDANRALMGCNMQRQGVPLLITEEPIVATGIEHKVAKDSGVVVIANSNGKIVSVSSKEIIVYTDKHQIEAYKLKKYLRSNQDTCINQKPLVNLNDYVKKGQIIADGPATCNGQLALGQNLLVAYMPWDGYNFEDAMLLSEKIIMEDRLTSIHIKEFKIEARDIKGNPEEITRDIPNVGSEDLLNLDENGIIKVGATVQKGDILVGKTIPKSEQQITPEERLLKVLFGKKAEDVQDASLRVPPGITGKVIAVRTFIRSEKLTEKDKQAKKHDIDNIYKLTKCKLNKSKQERLRVAITQQEINEIEALYRFKEQELLNYYNIENDKLNKGDELPISVNKTVKVYIASKLKVQVGDKLAGRHGNKGIVAKILPIEDMPRLPDGTPVDCVLSPLSIPSRMNVGQLLEVMLGWAGTELETQMITPVFDGANEKQINEYVNKARMKIISEVKEKVIKQNGNKNNIKNSLNKIIFNNIPTTNCKVTLYDGRTGQPFMEKVTIGIMYIMKLNHLVEDKMHARSTGPYSLITRQPLGGKAQFGGQRFGEMEVWALEGYGAAYTLQEFLTVKSDDVEGRIQMYDSIVKGETISKPGTPESFKVLVSELRALSLNVELLKDKLDKEKK